MVIEAGLGFSRTTVCFVQEPILVDNMSSNIAARTSCPDLSTLCEKHLEKITRNIMRCDSIVEKHCDTWVACSVNPHASSAQRYRLFMEINTYNINI